MPIEDFFVLYAPAFPQNNVISIIKGWHAAVAKSHPFMKIRYLFLNAQNLFRMKFNGMVINKLIIGAINSFI